MSKNILVGNKHIVDFFRQSLNKKKLSSFYIFAGAKFLGKKNFAFYLSKILLCQNFDKQKDFFASSDVADFCGTCSACRKVEVSQNNPDLHILEKSEEDSYIKSEQTREFVKDMNMSSFGYSYKVGIISDGENLNEKSFNALLKTLEEPKKKTVLIMTVSSLDALPQTIVSRGQVLNFYPVSRDTIYDYLLGEKELSRERSLELSRLSAGRPVLAESFLDPDFYEDYRSKAEAFLAFFGKDLNSRFDVLDDFLPAKQTSREAMDVISVWQIVLRDMLSCHVGNSDNVCFFAQKEKIEFLAGKINTKFVLRLNNLLEEAKIKMRANVSVRAVFENLIFNI